MAMQAYCIVTAVFRWLMLPGEASIRCGLSAGEGVIGWCEILQLVQGQDRSLFREVVLATSRIMEYDRSKESCFRGILQTSQTCLPALEQVIKSHKSTTDACHSTHRCDSLS
jgi:hypothetical protein